MSILLLGMAMSTTKADTLEFQFDDLVSRSFPPNLNWLNFKQPGFDAHCYATFAPDQWVEYVVQMPEPGSYRIHARMVGGETSGEVQLFVDGGAQGDAVDLYAPTRGPVDSDFGIHTFPKAGKAIFRFSLKGKNPKSQGYHFDLESVRLTAAQGFGLLAPEGACFDTGNPTLQWEDLGAGFRYTVYLDDSPMAVTKETFLELKDVPPGDHRWEVVAQDAKGEVKRSNRFHFRIGPPQPYPDRDFRDDFHSGDLSNYQNQGMHVENGPAGHERSLMGSAKARAYLKDVRLGAREAEVSALVTLVDPKSSASVGFVDAQGARICAVLNGATGTLSLQRTVQGYSIFAITPPAYRLAAWQETQTSDGAYVWQLSSAPVTLVPGATYRLKLAYSRRSCAVMATLSEKDDRNPVVLRDLVDINLPDHPMLEVVEGEVRFNQFTYRPLNRHVYPWDIDTNQIVLRPGPPDSWDSHGAFNPAIVVRNHRWHMVYRGNHQPAPPNGPPASDLGVGTSEDGIHWTKAAQNPIIAMSSGQSTVEDPDLLVPKGTDSYWLEYVILRPRGYTPTESGVHEMLASSRDELRFPEPERLSVRGKIGGMIDTHNAPKIPEFLFGGKSYRYLAFIEEGGIYLSNDLHQWEKMGEANIKGRPDRWCDFHECVGDIFVDADHNLRVEAQAGTGKKIVGNRLCTNVEDVLSGTDPTKVIARGDLPWLPDFYGNAPTGDRNEMTFTNGSVFPGQTIIKDGYLWHYYGGNNTFIGLIKSVYRPVFTYRDLKVTDPDGNNRTARVRVTIRNEGSFSGETEARLVLDGKPVGSKPVTLARDEEKQVEFAVEVPKGLHVLAVDDLRASVGLRP